MHRVNTHNEGNSVTLHNQSHTVNSKHIHTPTKLKRFKSFLPTKPPMNTRTSMTWCQQEWPSLTVNWWWRWQWGEKNPEQQLCCLALPTGLTSGATTRDTNTEPIFTWLDYPSVNSTIWDSNKETIWGGFDTKITSNTRISEAFFCFFIYSSQTIISGAKLSQKIQSL